MQKMLNFSLCAYVPRSPSRRFLKAEQTCELTMAALQYLCLLRDCLPHTHKEKAVYQKLSDQIPAISPLCGMGQVTPSLVARFPITAKQRVCLELATHLQFFLKMAWGKWRRKGKFCQSKAELLSASGCLGPVVTPKVAQHTLGTLGRAVAGANTLWRKCTRELAYRERFCIHVVLYLARSLNTTVSLRFSFFHLTDDDETFKQQP